MRWIQAPHADTFAPGGETKNHFVLSALVCKCSQLVLITSPSACLARKVEMVSRLLTLMESWEEQLMEEAEVGKPSRHIMDGKHS